MEFTGERVVFDKMGENDATVRILQKHLERYVWALKFVRGKNVLDIACGTGYGTWLLSLVTNSIQGLDKDNESIEKAKGSFEEYLNPWFGEINIEKHAIDCENVDTIVSFETIEHLEHPENFLDAIKGKELIFSVPIDSPCEYHKHVYLSKEDVRELITSFGWTITDEWLQDGKYFVGRAI